MSKNAKTMQNYGSDSFITINLSANTPNCPINKVNPRGWINYGENNLFPQKLIELYYNSPTNNSCIDYLTSSTIAKIDLTDKANQYETYNEVLYKLCLDLIIFGGYAFQIIKNNDGSLSIYHENFANIRKDKDWEDSVGCYWISDDWTNLSNNPPYKIDAYNGKLHKGESKLFYYGRYSVNSNYYPLPYYYGGIRAIQTEVELLKYDLKSVVNNFTANGVLSLNRIEDEKERKQVIQGIQKMFQGSDNANNIMITFKNHNEDNPVTFQSFDKTSDSVNLFNDNNERTVNRILAAHRISNRSLIGLQNSSGFSSEADYLEAAERLLERTTLTNLRKELLTPLKSIINVTK